jgi:hypothetical protein
VQPVNSTQSLNQAVRFREIRGEKFFRMFILKKFCVGCTTPYEKEASYVGSCTENVQRG